MATAGKQRAVTLTKPFSLEAEAEQDYRPPHLLQRLLSLFKNVRPGADLARFQVPAVFNYPKSQLQCYGEPVYCTASDMVSRCNRGESPLERLVCVVAWAISTTRPLVFGSAPYNPTLGETHHVSNSHLNLLMEQVSHHPPVSALHATNEKDNIEIIWCQQLVPKFHGGSVEAEVRGKRKMKLLNHGETYEMNCPNFLGRFVPVAGADWVGHVTIRCVETGFVADLCYGGRSFLGFRANPRLVRGKIFHSSSSKVLYEVDGHWDRTVAIKDKNNGNVRVIYDAREVISGLQAPMVKNSEGVGPTESAHVWSDVSQAILNMEWERAREAKERVEEGQREIQKEREGRGENWTPKHFRVSHTKEAGWDCSPIHQWVPPAPIIVL